MSLLEIAVEAGTSGPVVRLSDESDLSTVAQLSDALTAQIASGARHLVIDLSGLRFADSATIKVFTGAHLALNDAHRIAILLLLTQELWPTGPDLPVHPASASSGPAGTKAPVSTGSENSARAAVNASRREVNDAARRSGRESQRR